jgi:hypothetical protein
MDEIDVDVQVAEVERKMDELKARLIEQTRKRNGRVLRFPDDVLAEFSYIIDTCEASKRQDEHPTEELWCPMSREHFQIDTMIAPLMKEIWKAGWRTLNSCQDNIPRGYIWIDFRHASHLEKFLNALFKEEMDDNEVYRRTQTLEFLPGSWKYKFHHWTLFGSHYQSESEWESDEDTPDFDPEPILSMRTSVSLRFPQTDLAFVYDKLVAYNS